MRAKAPPDILVLTCGIMSNKRSGTASAALTQNRIRIERSSGFSLSFNTIVIDSSAMPQIGQFPGLSCTISGCIGQVYSVFVTEEGLAGSSAIPHFGQAPGLSELTSGSIGQM